jgi:hypothetical protein
MRSIALIGGGIALALLAPRAGAQTAPAPATERAAEPAFPTAELERSERALNTSGRLQQPPSTIDALESAIKPAAAEGDGSERPAASLPITPPPPPPQERSDVMALDSNMDQRVNDLLACRLEIAADRRVPVKRVVAGNLILRWRLLPDGSVGDAEAVAVKDTDPEVLACVQRKMAGWQFVRPRNAPEIHLRHRLRF